MKLTSAERIERSQLIPGVGPTMAGSGPKTEAEREMPDDCGPDLAADRATNS
jgi:hypothetical protein